MIGWRELIVTTVLGASAVILFDRMGLIKKLASCIP
jgi:hypothetical protein